MELTRRGFRISDSERRELLERIGRTFLTGFAGAARARDPGEIDGPLAGIPPRFRGFAYEGAAMAFATVDALSPGRSHRFAGFLAGTGDDHAYMAHVGLGWAMARLPRFRWPRTDLDPLLRWLVLDGYGFHQAYFHTRRYVGEHYEHRDFRWPPGGPAGYAARAIDQGVGRALWFAGGADPAAVADLIDGFAAHRRADLFSGAGLAATYAGGAAEPELRAFWERAGRFRPQVAQGCCFAAEARRRAGLEVPHTAAATLAFCGLPPREAAQVALDSRPAPAETVGWQVPAYEIWRRRIADEFVSMGRC